MVTLLQLHIYIYMSFSGLTNCGVPNKQKFNKKTNFLFPILFSFQIPVCYTHPIDI